MKKIILKYCTPLILSLALATNACAKADEEPATGQLEEDVKQIPTTSTADHSLFKELQKDFATGPEVTKACLGCHNAAAKQLHKTTHWTWAFDNELTGQKLGKKNVINNFCVATATNWARCTSCHIGYGWKDPSFDLTSEENVDCLVCHETTGTYKKFPTAAGHPNYEPKKWPPKKGKLRQPPDLKKIAQSVGSPTRANCGACHFYGGGGDGVKHGHLDSSMQTPQKSWMCTWMPPA